MQRKPISRRDLLKAAAAALPVWTRQAQAAAEGVGPMKITKIEAIRFRTDLRLVEGVERVQPQDMARVNGVRVAQPGLDGRDTEPAWPQP